MPTNGQAAAITVGFMAAIGTTLYFSTRPKTHVKIAVDVRGDGFIEPVATVYNATSQHILIDSYQINLDGVNRNWSALPRSIAPRSTEAISPGWLDPADYGVELGLHTAFLRLKDSRSKIYRSNTISFRI